MKLIKSLLFICCILILNAQDKQTSITITLQTITENLSNFNFKLEMYSRDIYNPLGSGGPFSGSNNGTYHQTEFSELLPNNDTIDLPTMLTSGAYSLKGNINGTFNGYKSYTFQDQSHSPTNGTLLDGQGTLLYEQGLRVYQNEVVVKTKQDLNTNLTYQAETANHPCSLSPLPSIVIPNYTATVQTPTVYTSSPNNRYFIGIMAINGSQNYSQGDIFLARPTIQQNPYVTNHSELVKSSNGSLDDFIGFSIKKKQLVYTLFFLEAGHLMIVHLIAPIF